MTRFRRRDASALRLPPRCHEPDWWLLAVLVTLVTFGTVMIFSATFPDTVGEPRDDWRGILLRQMAYVAVGVVGLVVAMRVDYHRYARLAFPLLLCAIVLLAALVFLPGLGTSVYGAKRWIQVGPISFQPSEVAKPILILYMATWLAAKRERVQTFASGLLQFALVMGLVVGLVMLQPDLGTSALLTTVGLAMFFVAGAEIVQFTGFVLMGAVAFLIMALSASYRRDRIFVFLNPDADVTGLGWQLFQARLALGSGGLFGLGLGASRAKFTWLPAAHNDAIFAVIGEELGLAGCAFLLLLFATLGYRGYRIALRAPDAFGTLIGVGITTWLIFQAAFNIGGITLAIPFTGIPLPFISSGGTALVVGMTSVGILLNVSRQTVSDNVLNRSHVEAEDGEIDGAGPLPPEAERGVQHAPRYRRPVTRSAHGPGVRSFGRGTAGPAR